MNEKLEQQQLPAIVVEGGMVGAIVKAELDTQIMTARANPRHIARVSDNIMSLATLDEMTAAECIYAMPRAGKPIRGPSIRMAEIIYSQWGNCRVDARVIQIDRVNKMVVAEGTFHDLETNAATRQVVQRRISGKNGRLYNDDMIVVTGNAACSIARRNAILAGVPKAVWRKAYESVEKVIAGDVKTLATRRDAAIKAFGTYGVKPEQIFAVLDRESVDEITLDDLLTLQSMFAGLKSGESTVEELFDPRRAPQDFEVLQNPLKDDPAPDSPPVSHTATEGGRGESGPASAASNEAAAPVQNSKAELLQKAYQLGVEHKAAGHRRNAIPGEFRAADRTDEATAWLAGFDGKPLEGGLL